MQRWLFGSCLGVFAALLIAGGAVGGTSGTTQTFVILYQQQSVGSDAAATVQKAGGTLVYSYDQIGVVVARSDRDSFRANLLTNPAIEQAARATNFATE